MLFMSGSTVSILLIWFSLCLAYLIRRFGWFWHSIVPILNFAWYFFAWYFLLIAAIKQLAPSARCKQKTTIGARYYFTPGSSIHTRVSTDLLTGSICAPISHRFYPSATDLSSLLSLDHRRPMVVLFHPFFNQFGYLPLPFLFVIPGLIFTSITIGIKKRNDSPSDREDGRI